LDATEVASRIAGGKITALEAMKSALSNAQKNKDLGAIIEISRSKALRLAKAADQKSPKKRGCFHGVPFLGKDLGSSPAHLIASAGVDALKNKLRLKKSNSELFSKFENSGLLTFGLTTVPEFGLALTSEPNGQKPARNPWNYNYSSGGSSGGAATAVAAGIVSIAHATDAAGSIRIPAACCGLMGLKPSRGTSPGGPDYGNYLAGITEEFVITRSIRDLKKAFNLLNSNIHFNNLPKKFNKKLKIGIFVPQNCSKLQRNMIKEVIDNLKSTQSEILQISSIGELGKASHEIARIILSVSLWDCLNNYEICDSEISPLSAAIAREGKEISGTELFSEIRRMAQITYKMNMIFDKIDVLLTPVLADLPPKLGHFNFEKTDSSKHFKDMEDLAPNASLANICGYPALTMPFGFTGGFPVGFQLMSKIGTDLSLLELGEKLDQITDKLIFPFER